MQNKVLIHRGTPIHYSVWGNGDALILLHGFLESREMWYDYAREWSKSYKVVAIDLPGHGESGLLGYVHTMEEMANAVQAVASSLRLRRYSVIGHSMGGYVALALAEAFPMVPRSVVLLNSTALADSLEKQRDRDRAIEIAKKRTETFIRQGIANLFRPRSRERFRKELKQLQDKALQTPVPGIVACIEGMKIRKNREFLLYNASFPFFFAAGKRDRTLPFDKIRPQLSAGKVVDSLITENGHMSYIEDRDICLESIVHFLGEVHKKHRK